MCYTVVVYAKISSGVPTKYLIAFHQITQMVQKCNWDICITYKHTVNIHDTDEILSYIYHMEASEPE